MVRKWLQIKQWTIGQTEGRTSKTVYLSPPVERGYTNILVLVKSKYYTRYNTFLVLIFNWLFMSPPLSGWDIYKKCSVAHVCISEIKQLWPLFSLCFDILTWYLVCGCIRISYRSSLRFVPVQWLLAELWPLDFEIWPNI